MSVEPAAPPLDDKIWEPFRLAAMNNDKIKAAIKKFHIRQFNRLIFLTHRGAFDVWMSPLLPALSSVSRS
jgi:hypothetical protein